MIAPALLVLALHPPPAATVPGDTSGFGKSLALLGDLDGDRCSEIAVGSPSDGDAHRGKVFVFSGKTDTLLRELSGEAPDGAFGTDVASVGDQDGDKIPDFAVGAPFVRVEKGQGRVTLFSGKDGRAIRTLAPEKDERYFGVDFVPLGDVDGDKKDDLLVRCRVGGGPQEHEVFAAVSLAAGKRLFSVASPPGVLSNDLGRPLASVPDLDGDMVPDFAVEYGWNVHLCSGKDGKVLRVLSSPLPPTEKSLFGYSICAMPGRVPGVAVGDVQQDVHGCVRLFRIETLVDAGAAEKEGGGAEVHGDEEMSGVGRSLASAGDVDRDGVADLAVGWSNGKKGGVLLLSGKDLASVRTIEDEPDKGQLPLGWRIAAGEDVDGDGTPDLAVARFWPTASAAAPRGVVIVSGANGKPLRELLSPGPPAVKKPSGQ